MGKSRLTEKTYSVDSMMRNLASRLVRDFQRGLQDYSFCCSFLSSLRDGSVAEIRAATPAIDVNSGQSPAYFKAQYQLHSIFKRHRFEVDTYSDEELTEKAINTFMETQHRLRALDFNSLSASTQRVVRIARHYIAHVLGVYDDEECRSRSRFGRKASVGIPARMACEAARWEIPLSGSPDQINWFDSEMSQIEQVQEYWAAQKGSDPSRSTYQETRSLTLTLVPKTFKSLRAIMPNTTIGSYMSYGIGEMIRVRLKRKGYDIRRLQHQHRVLAERASRTYDGDATCDLSSASDSISVALVEQLFPADWVEILRRSRIGTVVLPNGLEVQSETHCTMGVGYTFPLQTLVFLALLKAIQWQYYPLGKQRHISVYGDDMIYPSKMHGRVVEHLTELGFVINLDKSYHDGHFRESCGGDYYRGVDVRPFQPKNGSANVGQKAYEATLYKAINGLLRRWHECEIGETLQYLLSEIENMSVAVKRVPDDYPDDAGVRCPYPDAHKFLECANLAILKNVGHGLFRFSYLRLMPDDRKEDRHAPYLWLATRGGPDDVDAQYRQLLRSGLDPSAVVRNIHERVGLPERTSLLITKEDRPIRTFRSKLRGVRLRRTSTYVASSHTGRYTRQSGTSCFGFRR